MNFKRHHHKITAFLVLAGVLFLFLTTASPFMHNHAADFNEHQDCMVYRMEATLFLVILTIILAYVATLFESGEFPQNRISILRNQTHISSTRNRAPPV